MHRKTRLKITDINRHLTCALCTGYLVDATTIIECLHSYCRSCIVRYLQTSKQCPICDTQVHKTRPLLNIRSDKTLQNLVYKLVPSMFKGEMKRRRDFYSAHPEASTSQNSQASREERGEVDEQELIIYTDDEHLSLSLEYFQQNVHRPKPKPLPSPNPSVGNGDAASTCSSSSSSSSSSDSSSESGSSAGGDGSGPVAGGGDSVGANSEAASETTGKSTSGSTVSGGGVAGDAAKASSAADRAEKPSTEAKGKDQRPGETGLSEKQETEKPNEGKTNGSSVSANGDAPVNGKRRVNGDTTGLSDEIVDKRYLRCPAAVCIGHIKKFIRNKFGLSLAYQIEVMYRGSEDELLPDDYTLMDVAYIYTWGRVGPLPLVYRVYQPISKSLKRPLADNNNIPVPEKIPKKTDAAEEPKKDNSTKNEVSQTQDSQNKAPPTPAKDAPSNGTKLNTTSSAPPTIAAGQT